MNKLCKLVTFLIIGALVMGVPMRSFAKTIGNSDLVYSEAKKSNSSSRKKRVYVVSHDGKGDFKSIQEGVDKVPDGSTLNIKAGIYEENVRIHDKTVNLIGEDREKCILRANSDRYFEVPLEIAGGVVENLTIYGYTERTDDWVGVRKTISQDYINSFDNDNDRRAAGYNGYVVHIEQNYLQNRSLIFRNCEFLSDNSHCVGCGLRKGCNLVFDNCIFRSFVTGSGSMFLHDTPIDGDYGSCDVSIKDCQFYTHNSLWFMYLEAIAKEDTVRMHMQNNKFYVTCYSDPSSYSTDYRGTTVSQMNEMDVNDTLIENGFLSNDLVFCFDSSMTEDYKSRLRSIENPIESGVDIPEGITVLWNSRCMNDSSAYFPISIMNNGFEGGGWLNSAVFELADDSHGNTFSQFNY